MTKKRFEIIGVGYTNIDVPTYIVEYGNGEDDCFNLYESKEDSQKVVDLLNELNNENNHIKQTIKEAYESERTQIGRNVLRQLLEAIQ